jgi:hypothetical protein
MRPIAILAFATAILAAGAAQAGERPDIPFAPPIDAAIKDPDNPTKVFRVDFAEVEARFPLTAADRAKLTPENVAELAQEEVDQIYARLTAGPIPDGAFEGDLFFPRGDSFQTRLEEILGGLPGRLAGAKVELIETLGRTLWKGKLFDRDALVLRNFIEDFEPLRLLIDDPRSLMTAKVSRGGGLGRVIPTTSVWLLFPAKLYCGQSLLDGRRESVVIDYLYNDEIAGYRESPDGLAGRGGLRIRDEIRMVRPGFYLGRAYANRMFLLNFTLYNAEIAEAAARPGAPAPVEDCWPGEQVRRASVR